MKKLFVWAGVIALLASSFASADSNLPVVASQTTTKSTLFTTAQQQFINGVYNIILYSFFAFMLIGAVTLMIKAALGWYNDWAKKQSGGYNG